MNSRLASRRLSSEKSSVLTKEALQDLNLQDFDVMEGWEPTPGKIYTKVRAISARINQNYDAWPSDELKKSYRTFLGKPVFVNHVNDDPRKARGVVVAARFVENYDDKYVEVIQEVDADRFPMLAHELVTGGLDSVSMGAEARICKCSYCGNEANDMLTMCSHVLGQKGQILGKVNEDGTREDILVYEECRDISFFELSYVFDPADETAVVSNVLTANKKRGYGETALPPQVDTLRDEEEDLGSYFIEPPEEFQEPDLDKEYPDIDSEDPSSDRRVEEQREDYDMARVSRNSRGRKSRRRSDLRRMANDPFAGWTGGDNYDYKSSDDGVYRFVTPKDDGSFSWGVGYNHDDPDSQFGGPDWAVMADEGDAVDWEEAVDIADSRGADLSTEFRNRRSNRRRRYANPADIIEQLIQRGELSPAARNMDPEEVAFQYNESNALDEGDPDYLRFSRRRRSNRRRANARDVIEQLIQRGELSPGARNMDPEEVAFQYNESNALDEGDPDYLRFSRRRYAEEYGRNDQGEQEEVYISQTPPAEPLETGAGASDAPNNSQGDRVKTDRNRSTHTNFEARRRARRKRAETLLPGERVEWIDSMGNVEPEEAEILGIVGEEGGEAIYEIRWDDGATETAPEGVLRRASRRSSRRRARRRHAAPELYKDFLEYAQGQGMDLDRMQELYDKNYESNGMDGEADQAVHEFETMMFDFLGVDSVDDDDRVYELMEAPGSYEINHPNNFRGASRRKRSFDMDAPRAYNSLDEALEKEIRIDSLGIPYQNVKWDDLSEEVFEQTPKGNWQLRPDYRETRENFGEPLMDAIYRNTTASRNRRARRRVASPELYKDFLEYARGQGADLDYMQDMYDRDYDSQGMDDEAGAAVNDLYDLMSDYAGGDEDTFYQLMDAPGSYEINHPNNFRGASRKRRSRRSPVRRMAEQSDDFNLNSRADIARNVEDEDLFDTPVETQPKDASRKRRSNRRHANPRDIIEQMIQRGELSPAARNMDPEEVAFQYNESNALDEGDPDYLRFSRRRHANPHRMITDSVADIMGISVPFKDGWEVINNPNMPTPTLFKEISDFDGLSVRPSDDGSFIWSVSRGLKNDGSGTASSAEEAMAMAEQAYGQRTSSRRRRRMADTNLDLAAPDGRVNVEAPVSGVTDEDAQASQFDKGDYGHNAGDGLADPDLSTDQNWAPGEGKTSTRKASQIEGMRLAEAMVEAGLEKHDDRWKLAESYTKLPAAIVRDRISLLSRTASVKTPSRDDNGQRPMKSARKSPGLGNGPSLRKVADNKTDDYSLFF